MSQHDEQPGEAIPNRAERQAAAMLALPAVWHPTLTRPWPAPALETLPERYVPSGGSCDRSGGGTKEGVTNTAEQDWLDVPYPLPALASYLAVEPREVTAHARPGTEAGSKTDGASPAGTPTKTRGRVLVVDDDPDVGRVIAVFLRKAGFTVVAVANGDEAITALHGTDAFHVLVTDYAMNGMNGVDLVLLTREAWPDVGHLIVTGYAGADGLKSLPTEAIVLRKPFGRAELVEHVERLTGRTERHCYTDRVGDVAGVVAGIRPVAPGSGLE